jgi:hypothetical protein
MEDGTQQSHSSWKVTGARLWPGLERIPFPAIGTKHCKDQASIHAFPRVHKCTPNSYVHHHTKELVQQYWSIPIHRQAKKKKKIAHPLAHFPRTYTIPNPNYKTPYRLNPTIYPPAPQIQIYTITSPYTPPKNYESQNNSTTTTNKRLGFREIDRSCHHHTAVQLPWLRTNREWFRMPHLWSSLRGWRLAHCLWAEEHVDHGRSLISLD